jgi:hypothetical protein
MGNSKSCPVAHVLPVDDQKSLYKIQAILSLMKDIGELKGNYTIGKIQVDIKSNKYNWIVFFNSRDEMHAFAERATILYKKPKDVSAVEVYKVLRECGATKNFAAAAATGLSEESIDLRVRLETLKKS